MDYLFFDHVNQSLWDQIRREGPDFWEELDFFRSVKQKVSDFCESALTKVARVVLGPTAFRYVDGKGQFIRLGNRDMGSLMRNRVPFDLGGERVNQDPGRNFIASHMEREQMLRSMFNEHFAQQMRDGQFMRNAYGNGFGRNDPFQTPYSDASEDSSAGDEDFEDIHTHSQLPKRKLKIPASKWSPAFSFDAERCMGMYLNPLVFKNLLRVKQHPHLCKALNNIKAPPPPTPNPKAPPTRKRKLSRLRPRRWWRLNLESFDPRTRRQAVFHPAYCSKVKATRHRFSKEIVFARNAYGFSYVHKG